MDQELCNSTFIKFQPAIPIQDDNKNNNTNTINSSSQKDSVTNTSENSNNTTKRLEKSVLLTRTSSNNSNTTSRDKKQQQQTIQNNLPVVYDRYKHDMEQALAMKATIQQQKSNRSLLQQCNAGSTSETTTSSTSTTGSNTITKDDIILGINGIIQARHYKDNRQYQSALKLYELSIELLIKYLGLSSNNNDIQLPDGYNHQLIEQTVHDALTDAESIKILLKLKIKQQSLSQSQLQRQQQTSNNSNDIITNSIQSLTDSITGTIRRMTNTSTTSETANSTYSNATTRPTSNKSSISTKQQPRTSPTTKNTTLVRHRPIQQQQTTTPSITLSTAATAPVPVPRQSNNASTSTRSRKLQIDPSNEIHKVILHEMYIPTDNIQKIVWDDIAGLYNVKQALQESAILPLLRPDLFIGLRKPRNILLYGPPGTGKTMLVKAIANESNSTLYIVTSSTITSKWLGEGEKIVKQLFIFARNTVPSIIFIDEMDALLSSRGGNGGSSGSGDNSSSEHEASRRLKTEFMIQIDGINNSSSSSSSSTSSTTENNNLLLLACTNCPWDIDIAIVRRFQRRIYVPLPDYETRVQLLTNLITNQILNHTITSTEISSIAQQLDTGYSCSDITSIASEASFIPIRSLSTEQIKLAHPTNDIRPVCYNDFIIAISTTTKSISKQQLQKYTSWQQQQQM